MVSLAEYRDKTKTLAPAFGISIRKVYNICFHIILVDVQLVHDLYLRLVLSEFHDGSMKRRQCELKYKKMPLRIPTVEETAAKR